MRTVRDNRAVSWWLGVAIVALPLSLFVLYVIHERAESSSRATFDQMQRLKSSVEWYILVHHRLPGNSLGEVLQTLAATDREFQIDIGSTRISRGVDSWDRPIRWEYDPVTHTVKLTSFGANGIDDHGGGDDIVSSCKFEYVAGTAPAETGTGAAPAVGL